MAPMQNDEIIRMSFFVPPSDICYRRFLVRRPAALTEIFRGFSQSAKQMPDSISYRHNRVFSTSFPVVYHLSSDHLASEVPEFLKKT